MAVINTGKWIAGSILAAVVLNGIDYVSNNYLLASDWQEVAHLRNIDLAVMGSASALVTYIGIDTALAFLLVFTYAAIRPRFGAGATTAVIASIMIFLVWALVMATFGGIFFPWRVYVRTTALELASMIAAGLAGAWIYAEEGDE